MLPVSIFRPLGRRQFIHSHVTVDSISLDVFYVIRKDRIIFFSVVFTVLVASVWANSHIYGCYPLCQVSLRVLAACVYASIHGICWRVPHRCVQLRGSQMALRRAATLELTGNMWHEGISP